MAKEKKIKNSITIYLTDEENKKVRDEVESNKISINQYIRDAINLKIDVDNDVDQKEWKEEFKKWKEESNSEKRRYDNWVKKKSYFNGLGDY